MSRRVLLLALTAGSLVPSVLLVGCQLERVTAVTPASASCSASPCGASVAVKTELAAGTLLTERECATVCASTWCGATPISGLPGCSLESPTSVNCGAVAFDCGYCFSGCGANAASCGAGCCDTTSNCCRTSTRACRGLSCGACPASDARCTLEACRSFKACGGQLRAEPRAGLCGDARDAGIELVEYCPDACNASGAGALVADATCAGRESADGGTSTLDGGPCDCALRRDACDAECPRLASVRGCLDCAADCAIAFTRCVSGCR